MQEELLIKTLEVLEEVYPEGYSVVKLLHKLNKPQKNELHKILKYLLETNKINIQFKDSSKTVLNHLKRNPQLFPNCPLDSNITLDGQLEEEDKVYILNTGIDFLSSRKQFLEERNNNKIISAATVAIALAAVIDGLSIFQHFEAKTKADIIPLTVMGISLMVLAVLAMNSLGRFLNIKPINLPWFRKRG
ncbi:MAG: hypothetical protein WC852_03845 [Candidatus Nanoarchaeia archaeon]|jgi:hypothetical protein